MPDINMSELTPMMQQYLTIKENYQDAFVFFRLGDFYELFFEDAQLASKEFERQAKPMQGRQLRKRFFERELIQSTT